MKKINIKILALLSIAILFVSCDKDFEEINSDPNRPVDISADLLLGYAQRSHMNSIYGMQRGGDMGSCWAQQMSKVQYNSECRYLPRRGVIDNIWLENYTLVVSEAKEMYTQAGINGNTNLQGVALVMQAVGYQTLTDLFGPIPFTESINPDIPKPVYDDEATVYQGILDILTNAASLLNNGQGAITASSDLYYGGDTSKWLKLANSLKFRALMRISSTRDVSTELQALLSQSMFTSNDDNAQLAYLAAQPDANPIYETIVFGSRPEYKMGSVLVDMLQASNDDRLFVYASTNENGIYLGKPAGYGRETTLPNEGLGYTYSNISGLGDFYLNPELPGVLMSYSQLNFLKAEAANEGLIGGGISTAFNYYTAGITASFDWNNINADTYIASLSNFTTQADAREKIATQEWIALFGQGFESWTEWRRTKYPVLEAAIEGDLDQIPSRLYYDTNEASLNTDNYTSASESIGGDLLTSPLFWQ